MSTIPQPKTILTIDQFLDSLDQNNSAIEHIRNIFDLEMFGCEIVRIYKKDSMLYDIIMASKHWNCLPIVDKQLQVVIEAKSSHEDLTGALFCYHATTDGDDYEIYDRRIWGELYGRRGYGYYFSGAFGDSRSIIIYPRDYKPDKFDKDVFVAMGLNK